MFLESIWKATEPQPLSLSFSTKALLLVRWVSITWQTPALPRSVDLSSVCITLQLFLLAAVETTSFFNISGKSPPTAHLDFGWEVAPLGESNVLLSGFFHCCLVREQCVLPFSHDVLWGEEIRRDFSELPNLMQFCEGYFLPVRNPPISFFSSPKMYLFLSLGQPTSWQACSAPEEVEHWREEKKPPSNRRVSTFLTSSHQKDQKQWLLCPKLCFLVSHLGPLRSLL